jgi:SAM-dependent methyltransferase
VLRYRRRVRDRDEWEREAENWLRWARTPGHDAYWYYREAFFDLMVPAPGRVTLDLGCGEGRVTRDLVARGHRVVAVDGSTTLLSHARDLDPVHRYLRADASALPLGDGSVDAAVAYNSLMDFDDLAGAVAEVARILEDGSMFCICITHPMLDAVRRSTSGGLGGDGSGAAETTGTPGKLYVLRERYFGPRRFDETVTRDGLTMRFRGWSRTLEEYFAALGSNGFVVDALREPLPVGAPPHYDDFERYPMFLHVRAVKR